MTAGPGQSSSPTCHWVWDLGWANSVANSYDMSLRLAALLLTFSVLEYESYCQVYGSVRSASFSPGFLGVQARVLGQQKRGQQPSQTRVFLLGAPLYCYAGLQYLTTAVVANTNTQWRHMHDIKTRASESETRASILFQDHTSISITN
jgi:hypothetical protein